MNALKSALPDPSSLNMAAFHAEMFAFEAAFVNATTSFPTVPFGDAVDLSYQLREKYSGIQWPVFEKRKLVKKTRSSAKKMMK